MLREQVITQRGARGGADAGRGSVTTKGRAGVIVQRPSSRGGAKAKGKGAQAPANRAKSKGGAWQVARAWAPRAAIILVAATAGLVLFKGYRAAAASTFFGLRSVDVAGVSQASEDQIKQIVRRGAADGVWGADLAAISAEIERQPWVRSAVVTRVLPSGLRVRIAERVPRVVARTDSGRFVWVDEDAVTVGALAPGHRQPAFFMRGWDEAPTEAARAENRRRVEAFLKLEGEWEAAGLAARVSELNLDDLRDVRAQLSGDDSRIEVRLGGQDWAKRLGVALKSLDEYRATPRGASVTYTYVDVTGRSPVLGYDPNARPSDVSTAEAPAGDSGKGNEAPNAPPAAAKRETERDAPAREATLRRADASQPPAAKKPAEARRVEKQEAGTRAPEQPGDGSARPRRVGRSG